MTDEIQPIQSKLRIHLSGRITVTEQVNKQHDEGGYYTVSDVSERTVSVDRKFEGNEEVARVLMDLLDARNERSVYHNLLPDDGGDGYLDGDHHDIEVDVDLTSGAPAVFLAARKKALQATRENHIRAGYGVERVLVSWSRGAGFGFPDWVDDAGWQKAAESALFACLVDQTPGGEIDADAIPDRDGQYDMERDKQEMLPD